MVLCLLSAMSILAGAAATDAHLQQLVAMAPSPGAIALCARYASEPAVAARIASALGDSRAQTRAVAARVVLARHLASLERSVMEALAAEEDAEAAREEMRALVALAGPESENVLLAARRRFEGRLDTDYALALARVRGPAAIRSLLADDPPLRLTGGDWAAAVLVAARGNAEAVLPAATKALATANAQRWDALLTGAERGGLDLYLPVVLAGLASPDSKIASRTAWYLSEVSLRRPLTDAGETRRALDEATPADPDAAFAFGVLRRALGAAPAEDAAWIAWLRTGGESAADDIGPGDPRLRLLTSGEREVLGARYDRRMGLPKTNEKSPARWEPPPARERRTPPRDALAMRTVSNLPRGMVEDLFTVTGCRPRPGSLLGLAEISYDSQGRPIRVGAIDKLATRACDDAAAALFLTSLAPESEFPIGKRRQVVIGVARSDCLAALDEEDVCPTVCPEDRNDVYRAGDEVEVPVVEDRPDFHFPKALRREGVHGAVVLEAVINSEGCVRSIRVVEGVDPRLDLEAERNLAMTKYRPARLNGRPVPVFVTVTMTYGKP